MRYIIYLFQNKPQCFSSLQKSYDAVIILGGYISPNKSNKSYSFGEGADRLIEGPILYKKGIVKKIILSGGSGSLVDDIRESVQAK